MSFKNKIQILLSLLMILAIAGVASAVNDNDGNLPLNFIQSMQGNPQLRAVFEGEDNNLCQDVPTKDAAGTTTYMDYRVYCTNSDGSTADLTGCAVKFYDSYYNEIKPDKEVRPGSYTIAPGNAVYWERYNCYPQVYTCSDYESIGCNIGGCVEGEMFRTRSCPGAPSSVRTERCVPWYDCRVDKCVYSIDYGNCVSGKQKITTTYVDCQTDVSYQPCNSYCSEPDGVPGDTICAEGVQRECSPEGTWQAVGTCGSGSDSCTDPAVPDGETICKEGFKQTCNKGNWMKGDVCVGTNNIVGKNMSGFYNPTSKTIVGRVTIKNLGPDMKDTHLIEMQVRPKGKLPLAFLSDQSACDPTHPENVHRNFLLKAGENATITLEVPDSAVGEGEFDLYLMSRHKCYKDLTEEQKANYNEYQRVEPFPYSKKIATIKIGDEDNSAGGLSGLWSKIRFYVLGLGVIVVIAGFAVTAMGLPVVGIPAMIVGGLHIASFFIF